MHPPPQHPDLPQEFLSLTIRRAAQRQSGARRAKAISYVDELIAETKYVKTSAKPEILRPTVADTDASLSFDALTKFKYLVRAALGNY
jgi:hypothetical protein